MNYYKLYFSLIDSFVVIPFEAIHSGDGGLERRLEIIGIGGTSKKFWENETHSLFGNVTAKKSFFAIDSPQYVLYWRGRINLALRRWSIGPYFKAISKKKTPC